MAKSVEKELLAATGEEARGEEEGKKAYIMRVVKAANALPAPKWDKLSEGAQEWVNGNVEAANDKKPITDFPEPDADEPAPKAKAAAADDDAIQPRAKAKPVEDDEPAPKAKPAADDDEPAPAKKKEGAIPFIKEQVMRHPKWDKAKLIEKATEAGFTIAESTVGIAYYDTRNTLKIAKRLGILTDDYSGHIDDTDNTPEHLKKGQEKAKAAAADDEPAPKAKAKPAVDDDDEVVKPRAKAKPAADEDDEVVKPRAKAKPAAADDDDDVIPARRK